MMQSLIDISALLKVALAEDVGAGDITSNATIPADVSARFAMKARAPMVVSGLVFLHELFAMVDGWPMPSPVAPKCAPASPEERGKHNSDSGEPLLLGEVEKQEERFSGEGIVVTLHVADGDAVKAGTTLATISGPARGLLVGERVALNLVQQLSGVATLTRAYVDAVAGTGAIILDTRKTVPGLRHAQKYAVRCGGGQNHRMGLYDAVLIKDNHIAVAGGVSAAVRAARGYISANGESGLSLPPLRGKAGWGGVGQGSRFSFAPPQSNPLPQGEREYSALNTANAFHRGITIEVECDTLAQLHEALAVGVNIVLLDNMSNEQLREAVAMVKAHNTNTGQTVKTEASGNVSLATVRAIAQTGVDYISVGKLTHSATAVDIGLDEITS